MIGLSIFGIATKGAETLSVGVETYFLALIVIPGIIELLVRFCQCGIAKKFDVSKDLKIYKFFTRISIVLLMVPVFIFVQLPLIGFPNSSFNNSDVLGYYGALIGSGVTILGVYWTLNYESKKSKEERENERKKEEEERRKNSLPILQFTFDPNSYYLSDDEKFTSSSTDYLENKYNIVLNTNDECSIKKATREQIKSGKTDVETSTIMEYGSLKIENLGLGAAILSDVYLYRNDKEEIVNNLKVDAINKFIVPPGHTIMPKMLICSNDFSEDDYLCVDFIDLYSNSYRYEISFEKDFSSKYCKSKIESEMVSALPELVDTDNT